MATDRNYEDLSSYGLSPDAEAELLDRQSECTFIWVNREGEPVGVIMNFVHRDGRFWLTLAEQRKRVAAVRRNPHVAIAITSKGSGVAVSRSITYKGVATIHDDDETKAWFYPALAARVRPNAPDKQAAFASFLDSPGRVILEVAPTKRIGFDSAPMFAATPEAAPDAS
jgi:nitroimidazol reductase NimA-like FMN-containing flavoprotein (pyridoxamine 5'-phosphate oxidase superfamily)